MLNVLPAYPHGKTVKFWATISPAEKQPVSLPNPNPYEISKEGDTIFQPSEAPNVTSLQPGQTKEWAWEQVTFGGEKVGVGKYRLMLHTINAGKHTRYFDITKKWKTVLKGTAKWTSRGLAAAGAFGFFFEPVTGGLLGLGALGAKAVADDPADENYRSLPEVEDVLQRLENAHVLDRKDWTAIKASKMGVEGYVRAIARFYDYNRAIRLTIEKVDGAAQAGADEYVTLQLQRLKDLCSQASMTTKQFEVASQTLLSSLNGKSAVPKDSALQRWQEGLAARRRLIFLDVSESEQERLTAALWKEAEEAIPQKGSNFRQAATEAMLEVRRYGEQLAIIAQSPLDDLKEEVRT